MRERHWSAYLRLLPGGDNDVSSALAASGILYVLLFLVTLAPSYHWARTMAPPGFGDLLPVIAAGALPALVLAAWTGLRVYRSQPIQVDEVAASTVNDRTWRGDQVARVPKDAQVVSTGPRYLVAELADGSRRRLWYRAGQEERQLLRLARTLAKRGRKRARRAPRDLAAEASQPTNDEPSSGPESAGPESAGPEGAGPESAGPEGAGPEGAGPESAGPESAAPPPSASAGTSRGGDEPRGSGAPASEEAESEARAEVPLRPPTLPAEDTSAESDEGALERLVEERTLTLAAQLLPDPLAVETCLRSRLEELGVVLTRSEAW